MAEEKKNAKILSEDAIRTAIQSMKGKRPSADTELFKGDLPEKMPDRFLKKK